MDGAPWKLGKPLLLGALIFSVVSYVLAHAIGQWLLALAPARTQQRVNP